MKVLGKAATLIGAITLMFAIIVAQHNYQRSWSTGAYVVSTPLNQTISTAPERIARASG